jgi:hypothetical protein
MLDLKSFHVFLMAVALVLMGGMGVWGLLNGHVMLGAISLVIAVLLLVYGSYFAARTQRIRP